MEYHRVTTIVQHQGNHHSGARYMSHVDVQTDLSHLADRPYEDLDAETREWWDEVLDDLHAIEVEIAELRAEERELVWERAALDSEPGDVEDFPGWLRYIKDSALAD
jgi:hypothetical protein